MDSTLDKQLSAGLGLSMLREVYNISLDELSVASGVSKEELEEVEKSGPMMLFEKEPLFKKIFRTLITIGIKDDA